MRVVDETEQPQFVHFTIVARKAAIGQFRAVSILVDRKLLETARRVNKPQGSGES